MTGSLWRSEIDRLYKLGREANAAASIDERWSLANRRAAVPLQGRLLLWGLLACIGPHQVRAGSQCRQGIPRPQSPCEPLPGHHRFGVKFRCTAERASCLLTIKSEAQNQPLVGEPPGLRVSSRD